jgi:hypothetical protein
MPYDFSLEKRGLAAVAAGLLASGLLLFFAGLLLGAASAAKEPELALALETAARGDSAAAHPAAAAPCPEKPAARPVPAAPAAPTPAAGAADAAAQGTPGPAEAGLPGNTFRDEGQALALLRRMDARGVEVVIEATPGADGAPVFRVLAAEP